MDLVNACGLQVAPTLYAFINDEALPGTGVTAGAFCRSGGATTKAN